MTPEDEQTRLYVINGTWRTGDDEGKRALIDELATFQGPEVKPQALKLTEEIEDQMRLAAAHEQRIRDDLERETGHDLL
jgi:hypothetical protein